ncbi:N-acyl-L-amino acid amidohydrolase [Cohnella kolymensis]|uniref:N-acyl-L-amino acid amidohydrolase n=1 Tax=Cohnella kolymensis TaxID=1590652 RepID=A0ABR5A032_9BACL|nr:amidohydrolase [Cohnella kolymensis]KIL34423.1 N-acyl-L-amino acid amidohydrolase [Cohnella kolymensis]
MAAVSSSLTQWAIQVRRHLHENPELSGQEYETAALVKTHLLQMGIELIDCTAPSVVGLLKGGDGSLTRTVALRADMDALPIMEEGDKPYISKKPGITHACGHDGHTAVLLTAAKQLSTIKQELPVNVLLLFQSSEEAFPSGAEQLIRDGVVDRADAIFGIHLWQGLPKGKIGLHHGAMMASADEFVITIEGKGGHGSMPHQTIDPIYIASHLIQALQSIVSRQVNPLQPAVISVGKVEAGTTYNILPSRAILNGTVRTMNQEVRDSIYGKMQRVSEGICAGFGARCTLEYSWGNPPLVNDKEMSAYAQAVVSETFGAETYTDVEPVMGGEDFASYLVIKPGAFLFVGMAGDKSAWPHHHPRFDINEDVLPDAIALMTNLIRMFP